MTLGFGLALAQPCGGRLVKHAMGETCVPMVPQRVVVLDTGELDSALALGGLCCINRYLPCRFVSSG